MLLAVATRERANCLRRHVGAVLVADQRIIATGYNGTPTGFPNCDEGGCHRCAHPDDYAAGRGYDVCICVHAEQNAVLQAAKLGEWICCQTRLCQLWRRFATLLSLFSRA